MRPVCPQLRLQLQVRPAVQLLSRPHLVAPPSANHGWSVFRPPAALLRPHVTGCDCTDRHDCSHWYVQAVSSNLTWVFRRPALDPLRLRGWATRPHHVATCPHRVATCPHHMASRLLQHRPHPRRGGLSGRHHPRRWVPICPIVLALAPTRSCVPSHRPAPIRVRASSRSWMVCLHRCTNALMQTHVHTCMHFCMYAAPKPASARRASMGVSVASRVSPSPRGIMPSPAPTALKLKGGKPAVMTATPQGSRVARQ